MKQKLFCVFQFSSNFFPPFNLLFFELDSWMDSLIWNFSGVEILHEFCMYKVVRKFFFVFDIEGRVHFVIIFRRSSGSFRLFEKYFKTRSTESTETDSTLHHYAHMFPQNSVQITFKVLINSVYYNDFHSSTKWKDSLGQLPSKRKIQGNLSKIEVSCEKLPLIGTRTLVHNDKITTHKKRKRTRRKHG